MEQTNTIFGEWLSRTRAMKGMTLQALSEKSGLDLKTLHEWERGKVKRPQPVKVAKLAEALGIQVEVVRAVIAGSEELNELGDFMPASSFFRYGLEHWEKVHQAAKEWARKEVRVFERHGVVAMILGSQGTGFYTEGIDGETKEKRLSRGYMSHAKTLVETVFGGRGDCNNLQALSLIKSVKNGTWDPSSVFPKCEVSDEEWSMYEADYCALLDSTVASGLSIQVAFVQCGYPWRRDAVDSALAFRAQNS